MVDLSAGPAGRNAWRVYSGEGKDNGVVRRRTLRPRLVALAPTAGTVVRDAGGWLFDRAMSGWDVTVLVADCADTRPLDILGVRVVDIEFGLTSAKPGARPQAVAVDAGLLTSDTRVHEGMLRLLDKSLAQEVTLWGTRWPGEFRAHAIPVRHRLTSAARAFKSAALTAACEPVRTDTVERFRRCELSAGGDRG